MSRTLRTGRPVGPEHNRVAAVQITGSRGSGYLLTPRLVLTAAHVVTDEPEARVTVVGGTGSHSARVVWRGEGACDVALLVSGRDLVRPDTADRLSPVRWARLTDDSPLAGCQAMGFPRAQQDRTRGVDIEHIECALRPGSGIVRNRYVLDVKDISPELASGNSPWEGMSGAALFADGLLLGVVAEAPRNWRHQRLEAVKGRTLLDDASFVDVFTRHAGTAPSVTELSSATRTRKPLALAGSLHSSPQDLAATIRSHWATARQQFFERMGTPSEPTDGRRDLLTWLQQFDDPFTDDVEGRRNLIDRWLTNPDVTPDLKVLRLLGWLDPQGEAVWKGTRVTMESLATACLQGRVETDSPAAGVYRDLCAGGLLDALAAFAELGGLRGTQEAWDDARESWRQVAGAVYLPERAREWGNGDARGMLLAALLPDPRTGEWIRTAFGRLTPPAAGRVGWYDRLCEQGGDPDSAVGQLVRTDFAAYASADAERLERRAARDAERRAGLEAQAEEARAVMAAYAEHERQWVAYEAARCTPAARWGAAVRATLWLGVWGVAMVLAAWLVWGWTWPSMAVTISWHLPLLTLAAYAARLPKAVRLGAAYQPPLRYPRKWLPAGLAGIRAGLLKTGFVCGAVLVAGVLLHDVGQILTTILFVCLSVVVYLYADHDEGEASTTLRDWDDEHQARLRAHVTLQQEAEAHRADAGHFSSSPRERTEAYTALLRDFADGTIDVAAYAAYRRRLRSTDGDTG
ncbi:trypsin-like peptidase domain-containing protein [Streptomyces roseoverticillatus]|uniref:S1 family peptidase n=1 Tax=Streptomyces roseoverticillatus TaxID=66429 RepID=UPI001F427C13|nr:serine protease [Streptomyces roseoverticillatus]MCF3102339.1 trypsin-like peptidase domain-containing protein [Streptomyces roseoverticillatus]